jgi:hypothetical protein
VAKDTCNGKVVVVIEIDILVHKIIGYDWSNHDEEYIIAIADARRLGKHKQSLSHAKHS